MLKGEKRVSLSAWTLEMRAVRLIGAKRYDAAIECYRDIMARYGTNAHRWEMIAQCHEWAGEWEKAASAARRAVESQPGNFSALQLLVRVALSQREYAEARQLVQKALESYPEPIPKAPGLLLGVVRLLARIPKLRGGAKQAESFMRNPNRDVEEWYAWAREYLEWYEKEFGESSLPTQH